MVALFGSTLLGSVLGSSLLGACWVTGREVRDKIAEADSAADTADVVDTAGSEPTE
jgi:hypothetical protein